MAKSITQKTKKKKMHKENNLPNAKLGFHMIYMHQKSIY
jgi:hypothetical protein